MYILNLCNNFFKVFKCSSNDLPTTMTPSKYTKHIFLVRSVNYSCTRVWLSSFNIFFNNEETQYNRRFESSLLRCFNLLLKDFVLVVFFKLLSFRLIFGLLVSPVSIILSHFFLTLLVYSDGRRNMARDWFTGVNKVSSHHHVIVMVIECFNIINSTRVPLQFHHDDFSQCFSESV